jgi:hypothetical protein
MTISKEAVNAVAHKICEAYISSELPDEMGYFPVLWERLSGLDLERLTAEGRHEFRGLPFVKEWGLDLVSQFVIITTIAVLSEMGKTSRPPDSSQLEKGVYACATALGLDQSRSRRLAVIISPQILQQWQQLHEASRLAEPKSKESQPITVKVLTTGALEVQGRAFTIPQTQPRSLWLYVVREPSHRVHWLYSYLIFDRWPFTAIKNPQRQFETVVARLNGFLSDMHSGLRLDREKQGDPAADKGWWRLSIQEDVRIVGSVVEAVDKLNESIERMNAKDYPGAVAAARAAIQVDERSILAVTMLAEAIGLAPGVELPIHELQILRNKLRSQQTRLKEAIHAITKLKESLPFPLECETVLQELHTEAERASRGELRLQAMCKGAAYIPQEQIELDHIATMVEQFKAANGRLQDDMLLRLAGLDLVQNALRLAVDRTFKRLQRHFSDQEARDIQSQSLAVLLEVLRGGFNPRRYESLDEMKSALTAQITSALLELVRELHTDIPHEDLEEAEE